MRALVNELSRLNRQLACRAFILPGMLANEIDEDWLECQAAAVAESARLDGPLPRLASIALGWQAMRADDQIHELLEAANDWGVEGYYVVCEHPNGGYLVEEPVWLANLLDLVAGLRLRRREVIVGYCTHQMLLCAAAHATSIASGTWMNVRSFPPEKFRLPEEDEERRRAIWYYCPQALSEYKIPFLDAAFENGVLDLMRPAPGFGSADGERLFQGVRPSTIDFGQPEAFHHYLHCLHHQAAQSLRPSFDDTVGEQRRLLDAAEAILRRLRADGVFGQHREFSEYIDVNRSALSIFEQRRGPVLRREWANL